VDTTVADEIRRSLRWLIIATVFLYGALVGAGVAGFIANNNRVNDNEKAAKLALRALCTQRSQYQNTIDQTHQFLHDHPHGVDGLKPSVLHRSIVNARRQRKALEDLECPPSIPVKKGKS